MPRSAVGLVVVCSGGAVVVVVASVVVVVSSVVVVVSSVVVVVSSVVVTVVSEVVCAVLSASVTVVAVVAAVLSELIFSPHAVILGHTGTRDSTAAAILFSYPHLVSANDLVVLGGVVLCRILAYAEHLYLQGLAAHIHGDYIIYLNVIGRSCGLIVDQYPACVARFVCDSSALDYPCDLQILIQSHFTHLTKPL